MQMINKLLYRSRQRGFLELDLLVGLWAEQEVPKMDTNMLQQFNVVLDQVSPSVIRLLELRSWHSDPVMLCGCAGVAQPCKGMDDLEVCQNLHSLLTSLLVAAAVALLVLARIIMWDSVDVSKL